MNLLQRRSLPHHIEIDHVGEFFGAGASADGFLTYFDMKIPQAHMKGQFLIFSSGYPYLTCFENHGSFHYNLANDWLDIVPLPAWNLFRHNQRRLLFADAFLATFRPKLPRHSSAARRYLPYSTQKKTQLFALFRIRVEREGQ
jgi:hypothetical protein